MTSQSEDGQRSTIVVGGGLAGVSCALSLAERGHRVQLLERAPQLGGLCRSVPDPEVGRVDTGQHIYLGCCTALEVFLDRLGVRPSLRQRRLGLTVVDPGTGRSRRLRAAALPSPFHLAPVLLRWPGLGPTAALAAGRVAAAIGQGAVDQLDDVPALGWLQSLGQSRVMIERLWDPFLVGACNVRLDRCSAASAAQVIGEGLLGSPTGAALRIPGEDLTAWIDSPAQRALRRAGVEVRLRFRADAVRRDANGGFVVSDGEGHGISAHRLVLATRAAHASRLLRQGGWRDPGVESASELPDSPIVNVHLFTDRPFLPGPVVVVPGSPLQWLFDRSALNPLGDRADSFHAAISLSAADQWIAVPEAFLTKQMWALCRSTFPAAARARLLNSRVTREAHATFAPVPGSRAARPGARSVVPGIFLAGSWTATGWPATMEGAVRSGLTAAAAIM